MNEEVKQGINQTLLELNEKAQLRPGDILVIGCSTSEVQGLSIGAGSSQAVAAALVREILAFCRQRQVQPAFQCCEHLNRAVVVERTTAERGGFAEVAVIPTVEAGGALAAEAMAKLSAPVVVEHIAAQAKAGVDIGNTLIGMHLRPVAVPVRVKAAVIGKAAVVCAYSRPKLIGGARALYPKW